MRFIVNRLDQVVCFSTLAETGSRTITLIEDRYICTRAARIIIYKYNICIICLLKEANYDQSRLILDVLHLISSSFRTFRYVSIYMYIYICNTRVILQGLPITITFVE